MRHQLFVGKAVSQFYDLVRPSLADGVVNQTYKYALEGVNSLDNCQ